MSFDQIEERSRKNNGSSTKEVMKRKVFRDTSGRLRIEDATYTVIIDSAAGSRILLLRTQRIAYRTPWSKSGEGRLAFLGLVDGAASTRKLTATSEDIGKRTIEGIEFVGTRITHAAEGEPKWTSTVEQWYSDGLKLIGLVVASSPEESYTVRIQNLRREEANTSLFTIPNDYQIIDVQLPLADQQ